jgi:hypothetical protein
MRMLSHCRLVHSTQNNLACTCCSRATHLISLVSSLQGVSIPQAPLHQALAWQLAHETLPSRRFSWQCCPRPQPYWNPLSCHPVANPVHEHHLSSVQLSKCPWCEAHKLIRTHHDGNSQTAEQRCAFTSTAAPAIVDYREDPSATKSTSTTSGQHKRDSTLGYLGISMPPNVLDCARGK